MNPHDPQAQPAASSRTAISEVVAALALQILRSSAAAVLSRDEGSRLVVRSVAGEPILEPLQEIPADACWPKSFDRTDGFRVRDVGRHRRTGIVEWLAGRGVRAVLGVPLGEAGLLLVLERARRMWTAEESRILRELARAARSDGPVASVSAGPAAAPGELDRLRHYFNDDPGAGVIAAADGTILHCNAEFARLFGFATPVAVLGKSLAELEGTPGGFARALQRLQRGEVIDTEPVRVPSRKGDSAVVLATLVGSIDASRRLTEIRGYLLDSTHHRLAESALMGIGELFHQVEAATRDVLWEWDLEAEALHWNNGGPRRFRYRPDEMRMTIDWHVQRIHPEDRLRVVRGLHATLQELNETWSAEYRFLRGDGTYASVLDRAYISRDERGNAKRVTGWMLDISQWRDAEDTHRFLADVSAALDSTLDLDEAVRAVAEAVVPYLADLCRIDLYNAEGEMERTVCRPENEEERDLSIRDLVGLLRGSQKFDPFPLLLEAHESVILHGEGSRAAAGSSASDVPRPAGIRSLLLVPIVARERALGVLTLAVRTPTRHFQAVDVICARELARRTAQATENCLLYETARTAVADREDLLGFVSHDLKNPLNAILSAVALAKDLGTERRAPGRQWQDTVERAANQMRQLLDNLVDSSSIQAGRFTLHPELRSLAEIAEAAISTSQPIADAREIKLENRLPPDIPPQRVDPRQFLRVLSNLLVNALKFTPPGGTVVLYGEVTPNEAIVSVSDSGPGMSESEVHNVFTKYWQALPGDRRGTGLGLSIARGIVEAHGGRIWVESALGKGTTVHVSLPLARSPPP